MKRMARILLCCCGLILASLRADEPQRVQKLGLATLRLAATLDKDIIVLAFTDVLTLSVEVEGGAGLEVRPPAPWVQGPWQARPVGPPDRKETDKTVRWTQTLQLEPTQPGELSLAMQPLRYRDGDGAWQTAAWKSMPVRVTSRLAQPDLKSVRDITAIEELPARPPRQSQIELIVVGLLGSVVVVVLAAWWWRHRQTAHARASPEKWALYELSRLQALQLPEQGKHERFSTLLTGLMRRYLEKRYDLPARRQTTGEFLATLAGHADLAAHREFLEAFLRRCDLLKFAPVASSADECNALAEQVSEFLSGRWRLSGTLAAPTTKAL
mgnify:FL=1